ncbi:hypothetical protein B0F90DRAFT_292627 [Multifurca ochricompacta]|uniref:Uncharacterized protein n=1 Tax=Multifurca ochricompacta TaxID=376703 RepID=A0AAD4M4R4_9AGAM|nr:hypothetical protein B0F90DRAFT_292627 [Multifurca ochricompacta]
MFSPLSMHVHCSKIKYPYPKTTYCAVPSEAKTGTPMCRPLPQSSFPPRPSTGTTRYSRLILLRPPYPGFFYLFPDLFLLPQSVRPNGLPLETLMTRWKRVAQRHRGERVKSRHHRAILPRSQAPVLEAHNLLHLLGYLLSYLLCLSQQ